MHDFDKIHLTIQERYKLFVTRCKKRVNESFLGDSIDYLTEIEFIQKNYYSKPDSIGNAVPDKTYSVTSNYIRYLVFRREKCLFAVLNSFITPIVVSVITSVITVLILELLGLKPQ